MIKRELYPKTPRMKNNGTPFIVTEKLDGQNISIYKKDGLLYVGLRKNVFPVCELIELGAKNNNYKPFADWFAEHKDDLLTQLYEGSCIHGEWIDDKQHIRDYKANGFDKMIYLFAKSRISDDGKICNLNYHLDELKYPFEDKQIPDYLGVVPLVCEMFVVPTKESMDKVYDEYTDGLNRRVEGLVVSRNNIIEKYLRYNKGKFVEYDDGDRKGKK